MSEEQLKAFWEAIQANQTLQQKLQNVTDLGTIVEIAQEAGFKISSEELQKAQVDLKDYELKSVSGGDIDHPGGCIASECLANCNCRP